MKSRAMIDQVLAMKKAGRPIRKIAQALDISRNTVRRYLREAAARPEISEANYSAVVQPPRELKGWEGGMDWDNIVKAKRSGVTSLQLYAECTPGISYSRFCRVLRARARTPVKPACMLDHVPGERVQIDYADGVWITDPKNGTRKKCQLFCAVLPFSSLTYAEFSMDQKLTSFIRSHERMWAYFGGVTPYAIIDNLKAGVSKAHRYDPDVNPTYCDYANKTGFSVLPARPYTPRDKAAVEATIGVMQRDFYQRHRNTKFYSLADANAALRPYLNELNNKIMPDHGVTRRDRFAVEQSMLLPLPREPYELVEWRKAKVHPDCCIQVARALYSVPFRHCGEVVQVKIGTAIVEIFDHDLNRLACHQRMKPHGRSIIDEHLPTSRIQASSFEIRKAKAQAEAVGENTARVANELLGGERPLRYLRRVQGILRLLDRGISAASMEYACSQALTFRRLQLGYIKSCAENFRDNGGKLTVVMTPHRDPATIHLHGG